MEYEPIDNIRGLPLIPSTPTVFDSETFGEDYKGPIYFEKEDTENV